MKQIALTKGYFAIVDDEDFDRLNKFKWFAMNHHGNTYAARTIYDPSRGIRMIRMHRNIMGCIIGDGKIVDHIDGKGLNNLHSNLRIVDHFGNAQNAKPKNGRRFKGVFDLRKFRPNGTKTFQARITVGGRDISLGYFKTAEEAALAYNDAAKFYHGVHARLNQL